jgi:hypothetical protein
MLVPIPSAAPPSPAAFTGIALRSLLCSRGRRFRSGLRLNFVALPGSVAAGLPAAALVAALVRMPLTPVLAPAALLGRLLASAFGTRAGAAVAVAPTSFP